MKATLHCKWPLDVPTEFPRPVVIHVDCQKRTPKSPGVFDVLYLCEPKPIFPAMSAYAIKHPDLFDLIVVSSDHLLGASEKIVPLEYGTSWIPPDAAVPKKRPGVSLIVGRKHRTVGHRLRHTMWRRQDEIRIPKHFFVSDVGKPRRLTWLRGMLGRLDPLAANPWGWPVLGGSKLPLFESHYHLAIENCESRFYFSEKLLDCFLTDTIPIYWGCRNIGEYFDLRGIRQARTADGLIAACNAASEADYAASREAIAENRRRAHTYLDLGARLGALIASRL